MEVVNVYKGANPFVIRNNTLYSREDEDEVRAFIERRFKNWINRLQKTDYAGFCVDVRFDRVVGLVRLGELSEDTNTVRVWCHQVPTSRRFFGMKWTTSIDVTPHSTKIAADLVYTCEQVKRYGCPWSLMSQMSDFNDEAEGIV